MLASDLLQLLHAVLLIVGALLPVVNPPGNVPIFLNLTRGCDEATRRDLARHIAVYSFALLLGSLVLGSMVLRLFDLSVGALQVAGEAIQLLTALLGSAAVAAALLLAYRYAGRASGWIGSKGMEVMLRLSALLVLSIGVQIVWNGVKALLGEIHIA